MFKIKKWVFILAIILIPAIGSPQQPRFQIPGAGIEKREEKKQEGKQEGKIENLLKKIKGIFTKEKKEEGERSGERRAGSEKGKKLLVVDPKAMLEAAKKAKQKREERDIEIKNEEVEISEQIQLNNIPWETFTGPCVSCGNETITYTCDTDPLDPDHGVGYIKGTSCSDFIKIGSFSGGIVCETTEFAFLNISLTGLCPEQERFVVDGYVGDDIIILETILVNSLEQHGTYGCRLIVKGGGGNDTLVGPGGGWDCLMGGEGDDIVQGTHELWGDDVDVSPYDGNDLIKGVSEGVEDTLFVNHIEGGGGNDRIMGGLGRDWIFGGPGDDCIDARKRFGTLSSLTPDIVVGGPGDDQLTARHGALIDGGDGNDFIVVGFSSNENIHQPFALYGGPGDDWIEGLQSAVEGMFFDDEGNDKLIAGNNSPGKIEFHGASGGDSIASGLGDVVYGPAGVVVDQWFPCPSSGTLPWYCPPPDSRARFSCEVD